jgi:GDP-4-dehydro-6-deoxy-D-mannose reductase
VKKKIQDKKALITGINGFVGNHLAGRLLNAGYSIVGLDVDIQQSDKLLRADTKTRDSVELIDSDLRDEVKINELFTDSNYELVFHLAAQSSVKLSFENPAETFDINVNGTLNLLEAISRLETPPKTLVVSSSEIYGQLTPEQVPVTEDAPLKPVNPYAVSKATVDLMAYQYWKAYNLPIYIARAFSHSGPGQRTVAVLSDWAFQTAKIELGLRSAEIEVGNMEVTRDYTDVRDIVDAYMLILDKGQPGQAYNTCTGVGYKISDLLHIITSFSTKKIKTIPDPSRYRPVDIPILIGSPDKLKSATGWKPEITIEQTLKDLYNFWMEYLKPQIEKN